MKKIPPFKLVPQPLSDEARTLPKFRAAGKVAGARHRLGGEPTAHLEPDEYPKCPDCGEAMSFYGQFDSINDDLIVADVGIICVFYCFDCIEVLATIETS